MLQREQLIRPYPLRASVRVWLRETRQSHGMCLIITEAQKGHPLQSTILTISILFLHSLDFHSIFHSVFPFWDLHSINARIIMHMRKFIIRTQCARHSPSPMILPPVSGKELHRDTERVVTELRL